MLLAGGAALAVGAATIGLAIAQTPTPPATPGSPGSASRPAGHPAFLEALARRLGVTVERLQQAMTEARAEVGVPAPGMKHGVRPGRPGGGPDARGFRPGGIDFSVVTQAIGLTSEQLRQELPGKSLAQVAQAHGKNPSEVATALKNAATRRVDELIAAGRLDAERATQFKERLASQIDQAMNRVLPERPEHPGGRRPFASGFSRGPVLGS